MTDRAVDHLCPECGSDLLPTSEEGGGICIDCGWSGDLEDAAVDTSTPFDVTAHGDTVAIHLSTDRPPIRLSPNKAQAFAEALTMAASNAEGHRDPEDSHI